MNVAAILKSKGRGVATCAPDTPLHAVAKLLAEKTHRRHRCRRRQGGRSRGSCPSAIWCVSSLHGAGTCLPEPASAIMTRNVVTCSPSETLEALMGKMTAGRFRHVPVVENGLLVGSFRLATR